MIKTLLVAGAAVALGVIAGDMIDARVGSKIAGTDGKRETLRRGVRIGMQTALSVVFFGLAKSVVGA